MHRRGRRRRHRGPPQRGHRDAVGADRVEHLERALVRRDVIGQAKGLLMQRYDVDAEEAFARLRRASQHTNTKLYDIAAWLVACRTP